MKIFLYLISGFWLLAGTIFILFPLKSKALYAKLVKPVKPLFILPLLFGVGFLWAAPVSRFGGFIRILGGLSFLKGLFILAFPENTFKSVLNYFINRSNKCWRMYGVFMVLLGALVAWSLL